MNEALDFLSRPANVAYNWLVMMTEHSLGSGMTRISYEDLLEDADFFKMLLALHSGMRSVFVELLKTHTRPAENALDPVIGRLACHAAKFGNSDIVKLLLTKRDVDWNVSGFYGEKLITLVVGWADEDILRTLLQKESCSVNVLTYTGSALHLATRKGWTSIARMLLEAGADVEARGESCLSVIAEATSYLVYYPCWDEIMDLLLEYKADINGQSGQGGKTALHFVASNSRVGTHAVEYLVSKGAELNLPDLTGNTPLDLAEGQNASDWGYNKEVAVKTIQSLREAGGKTAREMIELPGGLAAWEAIKARQCARIEDHLDQFRPRLTDYGTNPPPPPEIPREPLVLPPPAPLEMPRRLVRQDRNDTSTMQCETCKLYGHSLPLPEPYDVPDISLEDVDRILRIK